MSLKKYAMQFILSVVCICTVIVGILFKQPHYEIITGVIADIYLILVSFKKRCGFIFGMLYAITYGIVLFFSKLYANAGFSLLFLLPVTLLSYIKWHKNQEDQIKRLALKQWLLCVLAFLSATLLLYLILRAINGAQPLLDATVFSLSILTCSLMVAKYTECWILNIIVNIFNIVMWSIQFVDTGAGLNMIALQIFSLLISLNGIIQWKKDGTTKNIS